jgi:polysaccharide export outer membrane protein
MLARVFFFLCVMLVPSLTMAQAATAYQLRHGDRVQVSVWREEALNRDLRVLPDGSISFPLIGRLVVSGLSTGDVEKRITDGLKAYIPEAIVTVVITATEGNSVFVLGKVLKPGTVPLLSPDTTVLQVLSQTGGLDRFANGDAIVILRRSGGDVRPQSLRVRYNDLLRGESLDSNVVVRAGDTILVP